MSVHDRWPETAALVLVVTIPTALGAYCVVDTARYPALAAVLIHGPLVLVALWAAIAGRLLTPSPRSVPNNWLGGFFAEISRFPAAG